jgi:hypothetical protein
MPSSPTDGTEARLRALACHYDQAYEALARDDVRQAADRIEAAGALVQALGSRTLDPATSQLHKAAAESHARLRSALTASLAATEAELGRVRQGRRVLKGYGDLAPGTLGDHVESRI